MNISEMSEKELKEAAEEIQRRYNEIVYKREEKRRRKAEYALVEYEPKCFINYPALWNSIKEVVDQGGAVDSSNIEKLYKKAQERFPSQRENIYPCPECGEIGALYVGEFGDWSMAEVKKKITCSCCGFICPATYQRSDYAAWEAFHDWLIKNGYLDPSVPMPK